MPQSLSVVRLSSDEQQTLTEAVRPQRNEHVAREVKTALRQGGEAVTTAAKAHDLDAEQLRQARQSLTTRQTLLEALPPGEAQQEALQTTKQAMELVDEALGILNG